MTVRELIDELEEYLPTQQVHCVWGPMGPNKLGDIQEVVALESTGPILLNIGKDGWEPYE